MKNHKIYGVDKTSLTLTEEAKKFADALANSRSALEDFKITLAGFFAPAGKKIADKGNEIISGATMALQVLSTDSRGWSFALAHSGASDFISKDRKKQSAWYKKQENQEFGV